ncbi:ABC transporter substrate-binding protein [Streptomyces sp. A7024]|uniref:ABC transporter substrate-binding protein n=1 Tax=Streptomyces coryli TaxID=1128680 RepID=A0A6G4TR65_9ACTN|nr:ABC transporter substrate-binding protein [Streptomyces coryli]NGN62334.1 ABC transporter substrate-binding protein [Streptomyces coryli]
MTDPTRRHLLRASAAGLLAGSGLLGACTPGSSDDGSGSGAEQPKGKAAAAAKPKGTLFVWMHESGAYHKVFMKLREQYEREFPEVTVEPQFIPVGQYDTKLLTAFTGGTSPDVCKIGAWHLHDHVAKQRMAPLVPEVFKASSTDELAARFEPGGLEPVTVNGKIYGLPVDFNTVFLLYRRDRFEDAGLDPDRPPRTWEEVEAFSKRLTNSDKSKVGMQWVIGEPQWSVQQLTALAGGTGGILGDDGKRAVLSRPAGVKALEYVAGLGNAKLRDPLFGAGLFGKGTSAMTFSGYFAIDMLTTYNKKLKFGRDFDVAPVPKWSGGKQISPAYSWCWSVPSGSSNQTTAWHFVNWLQDKERQRPQVEDAGIISPVKGWPELVKGDKALQLMAKEQPHADFGPQIKPWTEMAKALTDTMAAVAQGSQSPKAAAKAFDQRMGSVL